MWDWWWKVTPAPRIITKLPPSLTGHPPATNLLLSVFQCSELCPACMSHESYFYSVQYSQWAGHRHCMFMNASITAWLGDVTSWSADQRLAAGETRPSAASRIFPRR